MSTGDDLRAARFMISWVDSFHNGSALMLSEGSGLLRGNAVSILGHYPGADGGPLWGWRTEVRLVDADHLTITHFNLPPGARHSVRTGNGPGLG